jgi:predicted small lipoprotein YifL
MDMAMFRSSLRVFATITMISLSLAGCGEGPLIPPSATVAKPTEKAIVNVPVYRFAKISNGAYFYTSNVVEFDDINKNYPDFRFEGVSFQAVTGGGIPVYRFAKLDNGAYFYTTSVEEKNTIAASYPNFRYEGEAFNVPSAGGQPMYRLANISNGAYLYTSSLEEYNYAQTVGFRGEGEKFRVPGGLLLSGTVFDSVAWANADVFVMDSLRQTRFATTNGLGGYSVDITGLTPPLGIVATYKQPGAIADYMGSFLATLPTNATTATANITSLTTVIYRGAVNLPPQGLSAAIFSAWRSPTQATVDEQLTALRLVLSANLSANGIPTNDYDPVKLSFAPNQSGQAKVISDLLLSWTGNGTWIQSRRTADPAANGVYFKSVNPGTLPALTVGEKSTFPISIIDDYRRRWQACLAIPAASRISLDTAGTPTSLHPTCQSVGTSNYLQSGRSFAENWKFTLAEPSFDQNSIDHIVHRSYSDLDGKELAGAYLRMLSNDGKRVNALEIFSKNAGGTWEVSGNQRAYDGSIASRYLNYTRDVTTAASAINRFRTEIQGVFDPAHPTLQNIRAIRVKGPGLTSSGVVFTRSWDCGTSRFMSIVNKSGAVVFDEAGVSKEVKFTSNGGTGFILAQVGQAWPTTPNEFFADNRLTDPAAVIPPLSRYTVELFAFAATPSSTPVAVYTTTLNGVLLTNTLMTNRLDLVPQTFKDTYMNRAGTAAGARPSIPLEVLPVLGANNVGIGTTTTYAGFYSSSRNPSQLVTTAADYDLVATGNGPDWYPSRRVTSLNRSAIIPITIAADNFPSAVQGNPNTASIPEAANASCASQPVEFRSLNETAGYREYTIRSTMPDFTRIQQANGIQY